VRFWLNHLKVNIWINLKASLFHDGSPAALGGWLPYHLLVEPCIIRCGSSIIMPESLVHTWYCTTSYQRCIVVDRHSSSICVTLKCGSRMEPILLLYLTEYHVWYRPCSWDLVSLPASRRPNSNTIYAHVIVDLCRVYLNDWTQLKCLLGSAEVPLY
jgi:hypothetical protein